jgi:osmotically-inducible protein OsmY
MSIHHPSLLVLALALVSVASWAQLAAPGVVPIEPDITATVGATPSDTTLRDTVVAAIAADSSLQGARINVSVKDGVVSLSGTARDREQAERARAVVENIAGASRVNASISTAG